MVHILILVCYYYLYLSHARLPANNNLWGVIVWRCCCRSLMWVREFGLLVQHAGVVNWRWVHYYNCNLLSSFHHGGSSVLWSVYIHLLAMTIGHHQARKRRSSRHRKRDQQSTSSVFHNPSGLSANRRIAEDDKEGHLIYSDGDILHSRCTQAFVYLLIRRWWS